jgi:hypothetical protein
MWQESSWQIQKLSIMESDGLCLSEKLIENFDEDDLEVAITMSRRIWLCRNYVVYRGTLTSPSQLIESSQEAVEGFH